MVSNWDMLILEIQTKILYNEHPSNLDIEMSIMQIKEEEEI